MVHGPKQTIQSLALARITRFEIVSIGTFAELLCLPPYRNRLQQPPQRHIRPLPPVQNRLDDVGREQCEAQDAGRTAHPVGDLPCHRPDAGERFRGAAPDPHDYHRHGRAAEKRLRRAQPDPLSDTGSGGQGEWQSGGTRPQPAATPRHTGTHANYRTSRERNPDTAPGLCPVETPGLTPERINSSAADRKA
jgi:hypothetical protein